MLMPSDITGDVGEVLENINIMEGYGRSYVTAYQILERLSPPLRQQLIDERGRPGAQSGTHYSAASVVSDAAEMIPGIEITFLETTSIKIVSNDDSIIVPGNQNVGLYRL